MLHSFLSTLIGSRILSNKSDCFKLAQRKITLKVFYLGSAPVYSFPLNWFKKEFSLLLWPFSSFEAEDEDEKISRPHLGDLSLKLLITFLEISLIEKSLDFAFVVDGASLASLDDDDDVAAEVDVNELGKTNVNRFVRMSSLESCLDRAAAALIRKLGLKFETLFLCPASFSFIFSLFKHPFKFATK